MALWGNNDAKGSGGTVSLNYDTLVVTGSGTTFGGQKTNEFGIIYQERSTSKFIWSTVLAIGNKLTEDIKVGDEILWDATQLKDGYSGNHLVHQDWVQATN